MGQPAPDLSEFLELSAPRRVRCTVAKALDTLDGKDAERLSAALAESSDVVTHAAIAVWLERRGVKMASMTVSRHRRKLCSCLT